MKRPYLSFLIFVPLLLISCDKKPEILSTSDVGGLEALKIYSPAIGDNMIEEPAERTIVIYLPPNYSPQNKPYPVVYYLHGYTQSAYSITTFKGHLNRHFTDHPEESFIMVGVDGANQYGGGYYTNSPVTGQWETHIIEELIPLIDGKYNTIDNRKGRGIAGFSMGGYGAWELGFKYPQIFSSMMSVSGGAFDETGLQDALQKGPWSDQASEAYGSAFCWTDDGGYNIPQFDGSVYDREIIDRWENGFGDLQTKIEKYSKKEEQLDNILLLYGKNDYYPWIPRGIMTLSVELLMQRIDHQIIDHGGTHIFGGRQLENYLLPFFAESF